MVLGTGYFRSSRFRLGARIELAPGSQMGTEHLLHASNHRRRAAEKKLAVRGGRVGEVLCDVLLGDVAGAALPAGRGVVEHVEDLEALRVDVAELVEVGLEEDISLADVRVEEGDGGAVEGVLEGGADDLDHGRDTCAAGDHAEVADEVGSVHEVALGALDADGVADLELRDVFGDIAEVIGLRRVVSMHRKRCGAKRLNVP